MPASSKAADALAYAILFIPAFVVWKAVGGFLGLFLGALIIFLFRSMLARLLQMGVGALGSLKELLPALGVLVLVVLFAGLVFWTPWGSGYYYTLSEPFTGALGRQRNLTVRDSKGKDLLSVQVGTARGYNQRGRTEVNGEQVLTYEVRNGNLTEVIYKGTTLKERKPPKGN